MELVTATEIAERAIGGLKLTVQECEAGLGERLRSADRFTADLDRSVAAGQQLLDRLTRIVVAHRPENIAACDKAGQLENGVLKAVSTFRDSSGMIEANLYANV